MNNSQFEGCRQIIEEAKNQLRCKFCFNILEEPLLSIKCGHLYCKACVHKTPSCTWCQLKFTPDDVVEDATLGTVLQDLSRLEHLLNHPQYEENNDALPPPKTKDTDAIVFRRKQQVPTSPAFPPSVKASPGNLPLPTKSPSMKKNHKGETRLHLAAIKGDLETMSKCIKEGCDLNVKDNAGWTPLHEACNHNHLEAARLLLDSGADVNISGMDNETPLHDAAVQGHTEIVRLLVERGADVNARNSRDLVPAELTTKKEIYNLLVAAVLHPSQKSMKERKLPQQQDQDHAVILSSGLDTSQKHQLEASAAVLNATIVNDFSEKVTHLVTGGSANRGICQRTLKYLQAVLRGKWIVSFPWVLLSMEYGHRADEAPFEVTGTKQQPTTEGPTRARLNFAQQGPGLFEGATFYFHGSFQSPVPTKEQLITLVQCGGGLVTIRSRPQCNPEPGPVYHTRDHKQLRDKHHFIVYQPPNTSLPLTGPHACCVSVFWLLDCIDSFQLLPIQE